MNVFTNSKIKRIREFYRLKNNSLINKKAYDKNGEDIEFNYRIIEIMGNGTFGLIVKIQMEACRSIRVLKIVYQNPKYHHREIEYLCEMDHPNVINIIAYFYEDFIDELDADKTENLLYYCLVFPFYEFDLEQLIVNKKKNRVCELFKQAIQGIEYIHSKQICHRDIKPSNILVDCNYNLVICDFGSAKKIKADVPNVSYVCSRYYRAPENCMGVEYYDLSIDIWALGVTFADYATSYNLFNGISNEDQLNNILASIIYNKSDQREMKIAKASTGPGIRKILENRNIKNNLIEVLERCIVLNPRKRKSAKALLNSSYFNK